MGGYILKRILSIIPVLIVVAVVVFLIIHLTPGDPASAMLGPDANEEQVRQLQEAMGLNRPLPEQFFKWVGEVLHGNLGDSIFLKKPVIIIFLNHIGPTLSLTIFAEIFATLIAIPLGIMAATRRDSYVDQFVMGFALFGISVPSFLLGLFMILLFAVKIGIFPVAGYVPLAEGLFNHLRFIIMPGISLGIMSAAHIARMVRSSMLDVLSRDYIKTARAKGLREKFVIYKHALRNAFIPALEIIGQQIGLLIGGAAVIETVFNIPGIGQLVVTAIERRDYPIIQGIILIIASSYVLINLLLDFMYGIVNPQVRFTNTKGE